MIKRYATGNEYGDEYNTPQEHPYGPWVKYEDYIEAVRKTCDEGNTIVANLQGERDGYKSLHSAELERANRLREESRQLAADKRELVEMLEKLTTVEMDNALWVSAKLLIAKHKEAK